MNPHELFNFCPNCRTELEHFGQVKAVCKSCGLIHYFNSIPCCGVIVYNDTGKILLVERKKLPFPDSWAISGGFFEQGETMEQAMIREVNEEIGLVIEAENLEYIASKRDRYLYNNELSHVVIFFARVKLPEGQEPVAGDDAKSCAFYDLAKIPWDEIRLLSNIEILQIYQKKYGTNQ